jgi:hypothetical protein
MNNDGVSSSACVKVWREVEERGRERRRTLRNILVLQSLSRRQPVNLVEEVTLVNRVVLPVPRLDHPQSSTSDVLETEVETAETVTDDEEKSVRLDGVLALGEESGIEAEGECHFGRGEEVGFKDGRVESDEGVEDEGVVLVEDGLVDESAEFVVRLDLGGLETGVGEGGNELVAENVVVMAVSEGNVGEADLRKRVGESVIIRSHTR